MIFIAFAVKISSRGGIIYWSDRIGKNNAMFKMPKFRTMMIGTPSVATHLLQNPKSNLTPIGNFLRKFSLDEFPQLMTILIGDMLIGNKFIYGMRTPNWIGVPYTRIGFYIPEFRLPKFKEIENGDVVIFEFPRDPFQKYVKRCIGLPGDRISILEGKIYINNEIFNLPEMGQFTYKFKDFSLDTKKKLELPINSDTLRIYKKNQTSMYELYYSIYPDFKPELYKDVNRNWQYDPEVDRFDKINNDYNLNGKWDYGNVDNINPFIVPHKGMKLDL